MREHNRIGELQKIAGFIKSFAEYRSTKVFRTKNVLRAVTMQHFLVQTRGGNNVGRSGRGHIG